MASSPYQDAITLLRETQSDIEKLSSSEGWEIPFLRSRLKTMADMLANETDKLDVNAHPSSLPKKPGYSGTFE